MKLLSALLSVFLLQIAGCSDNDNQVPEPLFEVFAPKGLRISIPDFRDVKTVEFSVNVPGHPDTLSQYLNHTNGNSWVFWNPDVVLHLYDKIQFKIMVLHGDLYCTREGTHVVQKVSPLSGHSDDTSYSEEQGQKIISGFPSLGEVEERHKGMLTTGKASNFKSSYSMQKSSEMKPITKSSMSTTSGTFYVRPSGVMEATGYKSGSSFDSTKREGEQWRHYKSELTAEELENMKNLYGSGFPEFLGSDLFPSRTNAYQKSYMSSESKSFPSGLHSVGYEESPVSTHKYHQTHKTHETSSFTHSKPVFQYHYSDNAGSGSMVESNRQSEKLFKLEPFTGLPNPLPPQGTIVKTTEYVREEHTLPAGEVSQVHVDRESHSSSGAPQKIVQVSQTGEFSSHNQEIVKPVLPKIVAVSASGRGDQMEYSSGNLQTVDRQEYRSRHYLGNIFTSVKTSKVKSPQECDLIPGVDYSSTGNVREVEKRVHELSCLATLAESTMKEELALLRQKNGEMNRRMELLEHEVKRLASTCNCYE